VGSTGRVSLLYGILTPRWEKQSRRRRYDG